MDGNLLEDYKNRLTYIFPNKFVYHLNRFNDDKIVLFPRFKIEVQHLLY